MLLQGTHHVTGAGNGIATAPRDASTSTMLLGVIVLVGIIVLRAEMLIGYWGLCTTESILMSTS